MIGTTLGHYTIKEKIGSGGMGVVYRAHDSRLERDVALKVLPSEKLADTIARKRFRQEALALSRINHPNIASVYDFDSKDGVDLIVMELVVGETISSKIGKAGRLSEPAAIDLGIQIAAALQEAHDCDVIHRDLKPGNVLVTARNQAKVLDFGLAQLVRVATDQDVTRSGSIDGNIRGTLPYMAPELFLDEHVDSRVDLYALGIVLYEMLTGQRPFHDESTWRLTAAIIHAPPRPPREIVQSISEEMNRIVLRAIEKDRTVRYQSAMEIAEDLRRLARSQESGAPASPKPSAPSATAERADSIVALPSKVFGPETDQFLADAIPNTLTTYMSRIPGLEAKVPPTNINVESLQWDLRRIADAYGVSMLVVSSVTTLSNKLILNVQLVEAVSRKLIWSEEYEGSRENYIQLIRNAARGIQQAIRPDRGPISAVSQVPSVPELELMLQRALYYQNLYATRANPGDFDNALAAFTTALDLAPRRADVPAAIAQLYIAKEMAGSSFGEIVPDAEKWARRALELDSNSSKAWAVLSDVERMRPGGSYRTRLECALKAAAFGPQESLAHSAVGNALFVNSYLLAVEAWDRAFKTDPLALSLPTVGAILLASLGREAAAIAKVDAILKTEPDLPLGLLSKALVLIACAQTDEAHSILPRLEALVKDGRLQPDWFEFAVNCIAFQKAMLSNDTTSIALTQWLVSAAKGERPFPRWGAITQGVAPILAHFGKLELALDVVCFRNDAGIVDPYDYLVFNPDLAPLRQDSRYKRIESQSRGQFEGMLLILELCEARGEQPAYLAEPLAELRKRIGVSTQGPTIS